MLTFFDDLRADVAYGVRWLRRSPGFATAAILSLALGIGANAAIFDLLNAVLLRNLPVRDPGELVVLVTRDAGREADRSFSYRTFEAFRRDTRTLSDLVASASTRMNVDPGNADGQAMPPAAGQMVSGNYFAALGVPAAIGRTILPADDDHAAPSPVAVLSYGYWRRQFGGDPAAVGRTIRLNGYPFTIVGVSAPEFFGTHVGEAIDISVPIALQPEVNPDFGASLISGVGAEDFWLELMGRLRANTPPAAAQAELDGIFQQILPDVLKKAGPKAALIGHPHVQVEPGSKGLSELRRRFSRPLSVLMAVVCLVLLIACANVANLLLARAASRQREIAVRISLGAGRARVVRQLLTESLLLALAGGTVGLLMVVWSTQSLTALLVGSNTRGLATQPELGVLGFTFGVSLATGFIFGLVPALRVSRVDPFAALKDAASRFSTGGRRFGVRGVLVAAQVAISVVLLVGAGLFVRTLMNLRDLDLGFDLDHVLTLRLEPRGSNQKRPNEARLRQLYEGLVERVRALPGVRSVSLAGSTPLGNESALMIRDVEVPGDTRRSGENLRMRMLQIYPGYFSTLGIPLVAGRDLGPADNDGNAPQVAVINETMARRLFATPEAAIGRQFGFPVNRQAFRIVGVVGDTRDRAVREEAAPLAYATYAQTPTGRGQMTLLVRATGDPHALAATVRRLARDIDPAMPLPEPTTLGDRAAAATRQERLVALLSSLFGALALMLATIGLYGVLAYAVARRQAEFGVRLALGASPSGLIRLILGESLGLVVAGLAIGLALAAAAARSVSHMLYGLAPFDPTAFVAASSILMLVAALAAFVPARQAARVDPMVALRQE
jgi:predicted permease